MTTPLKWLYFFIVALLIVLFVVYFGVVQNTATSSAEDTEGLMPNASVGTIRANAEEGNDGYKYFDKEELVSSLVANIAESQTNYNYNTNLYYLFLDENGEVTEDEDDMRQIQFLIQYVDDEGEVYGSAERTLSFHTLEE